MENSLALLEQTLRLGHDVQIVPRDIRISPDLSDEHLPAIANRILAVRGYSKWALGAILNQMVERRPKLSQGRPTGDFDTEWAHSYAEAHAIDPKERRLIMGVYAFYPAPSRTFDLSWETYAEAMLGVCDGKPNSLSRAIGYLTQAHHGGMSVTTLRRHIRTSQATEQPEPTTQTEADLSNYNAVFDFRRFCSHELQGIDAYTPERARLVLFDLGPAEDYIARLRSLASQLPTEPHPVHATGK